MSEKRYEVTEKQREFIDAAVSCYSSIAKLAWKEIPAGSVPLTREQAKSDLEYWFGYTNHEAEIKACLDKWFGKEQIKEGGDGKSTD